MTRQLQAVSDFQKATQHYIAGLPPDRGNWLTDHRWSAAKRFADQKSITPECPWKGRFDITAYR